MLTMKTKPFVIGCTLLLISLHCFCQLKKHADSTKYTYLMTIPDAMPQTLFDSVSRAHKDSASFIFIEFGDGTFASSYNGISSRNIQHHYDSTPSGPTVMFVSSVYDTTRRPKLAFFSKPFNQPKSTVLNNKAVLPSGSRLKITPSISDSLILLRDSMITFAITYKHKATPTLLQLKVSYGNSMQNVFSTVNSSTQTMQSPTETDGHTSSSIIHAIRMYKNAVIKGISVTGRSIIFTLNKSSLDGKEHSVFITLRTANVDIESANNSVIINAELDSSNLIISKTSLPMHVTSDGFTHDPNKLIPLKECLQFKSDTGAYKRSNITAAYTLHIENSGDGFVNEITTKTFIPIGLMTPSYTDNYYKPPTMTRPDENQIGNATGGTRQSPGDTGVLLHVNTNQVITSNSNQGRGNTDTFPIITGVFHTGDLPVTTRETPVDKRIKIDSISVHGEQLLSTPFYITKVDTVFRIPTAVSNDSISAKFSYPFLYVVIKNTNSDGTYPLLYAYQQNKKNITAEIKYSLQTSRTGYNKMMSWSSVVFDVGGEYYTQPALIYMTMDSVCDCIKETTRSF